MTREQWQWTNGSAGLCVPTPVSQPTVISNCYIWICHFLIIISPYMSTQHLLTQYFLLTCLHNISWLNIFSYYVNTELPDTIYSTDMPTQHFITQYILRICPHSICWLTISPDISAQHFLTHYISGYFHILYILWIFSHPAPYIEHATENIHSKHPRIQIVFAQCRPK